MLKSLQGQEYTRTSKKGCQVGKLIAELEPEDAEILTALVMNPSTNLSALSRALLENDDIDVSSWSFNHHRMQKCQCRKVYSN